MTAETVYVVPIVSLYLNSACTSHLSQQRSVTAPAVRKLLSVTWTMAQKPLTEDERHQIIMDHLKEISKTSNVFHLRWNEHEDCKLTAKVVTTVTYLLSGSPMLILCFSFYRRPRHSGTMNLQIPSM